MLPVTTARETSMQVFKDRILVRRALGILKCRLLLSNTSELLITYVYRGEQVHPRAFHLFQHDLEVCDPCHIILLTTPGFEEL